MAPSCFVPTFERTSLKSRAVEPVRCSRAITWLESDEGSFSVYVETAMIAGMNVSSA